MLVGTKETIEHRVLEVLHAEYAQAKLDQNFVSIGMDSLDYLHFIVKVEEEFGATVPELKLFRCSRDIVTYLEDQWNSK